MAEVVEVPESQPASNAAEIVKRTFADFVPQQDAAPEVVTPPAPVEEEEPFDPATIRIPNRQFVGSVPKALEKFKDKSLVDIALSYENAERQMHQKSADEAQARRENEELRARLAAAEQIARMTPQVQPPQIDYWQQAGINPDEAIITDPRRVLDINRQMSVAEARAYAAQEANRVRDEIVSNLQQQHNEAQIITAFEFARKKVSELYGSEIPVEQWQQDLQYIAPAVMRENVPERMFDHNSYVEHYTRLKGAPKASVPVEGNPPVSARPASPQEKAVPSIPNEMARLKEQIGRALGPERLGDAYKNYVKS